MANFTVKDLPDELLERFTIKARSEGWPPAKVLEQLMFDYVNDRVRPSRVPAARDAEHEFSFGGKPFVVRTKMGPPSTSRMFAVVDEGWRLRPLVAKGGAPIEFTGTADVHALAYATRFLQNHFGPPGRAKKWENPPGPQDRVVLEDVPVVVPDL